MNEFIVKRVNSWWRRARSFGQGKGRRRWWRRHESDNYKTRHCLTENRKWYCEWNNAFKPRDTFKPRTDGMHSWCTLRWKCYRMAQIKCMQCPSPYKIWNPGYRFTTVIAYLSITKQTNHWICSEWERLDHPPLEWSKRALFCYSIVRPSVRVLHFSTL